MPPENLYKLIKNALRFEFLLNKNQSIRPSKKTEQICLKEILNQEPFEAVRRNWSQALQGNSFGRCLEKLVSVDFTRNLCMRLERLTDLQKLVRVQRLAEVQNSSEPILRPPVLTGGHFQRVTF